MKLAHIADVHIGSPMAAAGDLGKSALRRRELLEALSRALTAARGKGAEAALIAGDLFESSNVSLATVEKTMEILAQSAMDVYISPGNHDFFDRYSYYHLLDFPENVKVFSSRLACIDAGKAYIWGGAFAGQFCDEPLYASFPELAADKPNILLVHADIYQKNSRYNYLSDDVIKASGFDYIALGHIHQRSQMLNAGKTRYAYPGCLEGRGFDEMGEKGFYLVDIDREAFSFEFIPNSIRRYETVQLDISDFGSDTEVAQAVQKYLSSLERDLVRIELTGRKVFAVDVPFLQKTLKDAVFSLEIVDSSRTPKNRAQGGMSLESIFERLAAEKIQSLSDDEREAALLAVDYGLRALAGEEPCDYD